MFKVEFKKDFGVIDFGKFKGEKWDDLKIDYLEYLISEECNTSEENKRIAKKVLENKKVLDGQLNFIK